MFSLSYLQSITTEQQFTRVTDILSYKQEPQIQAVSATNEIFLPGTPLVVQSVDAAPVEAGSRLWYAGNTAI